MRTKLCPKNHTPQNSPASAGKHEARPKPLRPAETGGLVVGRNGRIYKLKLDANKRHELYSVWSSMRTRCFNPKAKDFKHYGGRGITICERWNDFKLFVHDMRPRPTKKHELDRIKNDGNYEPGNCKWSTRFEQLQHTRRNRYVKFNGQTKTVSQWVREMGTNRIRDRLTRGWSIDSAFSIPKQHPGNGKLAWETRRNNKQHQ